MNPLVDQYISRRPSMNLDWINSKLPFHKARMTWSKEENILDFGCGPGTITRDILLPQCVNLKKLIGVDIQPVFVEYAKKTFNHEKIEYREINLMQRIPPEWEGTFHKIFSLFSIHCVKDTSKLLKVFHRLLKPGGYLLALGICTEELLSSVKDMSKLPQWMEYIQNVENFFWVVYDCSDPYGTTKKLADECGFDTDFFALTPQTQVFSSKSQYIQFCESIMPEAIMKRIPSEKLEDFWADWCEMAQKYKVNFKADGTVLREVTMLEMCLISKI
ncbi:juvenile hormone acid O-methyltransferase-like isoform X2 [Tachypleus tridentatus]